MGRGRTGLTEQSQRKPKQTGVQRGTPIEFASVKNRETKKIQVPEHVIDLMKKMNPQQLVDFLLPNLHVKTSSGN